MYRSLSYAVVSLAWAAVFFDRLPAEDVYIVQAIGDLEIIEGELPKNLDMPNSRWWNQRRALPPRAVLNVPGEVYLGFPGGGRSTPNGPTAATRAMVAVRTQPGQDVSGRIFFIEQAGSGVQTVKFKKVAGGARLGNKTEFWRMQQAHYQTLLRRDLAGAAWFRHRYRQATRQLGETKTAVDARRRRRFFGTRRANDMENTFALFSGGRAVSENLQLDRVLPRAKPAEPTVKLDSIKGITVREFDWQPLLQQAKSDPLAALIPDDQHALFFPSFVAMTQLIDHAQRQGTPLLRSADLRAENALTRERYQRQLCLPLGEVERLLGPQLISSVAVTGGDPYVRTGTDVAVLFQARNTAALLSLIQARLELALHANPGTSRIEGVVDGVKYTAARSASREVCAYVAALGGVVVVSNSLPQLKRIVEVHQDERPALTALPEYTFFRTRYPLGDPAETSLLIISDKTIRRWCGPWWRIATSRRTRAAAVVSELQADQLDGLVRDETRTAAV